jgi:hypothetical protein
MTNDIRLIIPAEEDFRPIAHLVTGGLALRLDLTYDALEDLQVALDALLSLRDDAEDVEVTLRADDGAVRALVGPLPAAALEDDGNELGVRRVLEAVVDTVELEERDGGAWVELKKAAG